MGACRDGARDGGLTLYTIGHGTRSMDELVATLRGAGVRRLIDVRRYPGSRRYPHFSRDVLSRELRAHGVAYAHASALGGRRESSPASRHTAWRVAAFRGYADHMDTAEFRDAFDAILDDASYEPIAVMCAETLWTKCHRRLIADAAMLRGATVVHLIDERRREPHRLHDGVRPDAEGRPVYDVTPGPPAETRRS